MNLINIEEANNKNQTDEDICISLDFGTTKFCMCCKNRKENNIFKLKWKKLIPSIVLYDGEKKIIGNDAVKKEIS